MPKGVYIRKPFTREHRKNLSIAQKGKKHTKEHCKKNGEVHFKGGKKLARKRECEKLRNNLKYIISHRMSGLIYNCLKKGIKNGRTWQSLVPYNYRQLKKHLEFTMPISYNWQDFLNGKLHIDHIIPISEFNFDKPKDLQFQQCWALSNLRLLPKKENLKKGAKLIKPFQLGIAI